MFRRGRQRIDHLTDRRVLEPWIKGQREQFITHRGGGGTGGRIREGERRLRGEGDRIVHEGVDREGAEVPSQRISGSRADGEQVIHVPGIKFRGYGHREVG